jgi:hypothetical protein
MTERSLQVLKDSDVTTLNRLFAEATKGAAQDARARGSDVMGMAAGRFIVCHPDGSTSPFPAPK